MDQNIQESLKFNEEVTHRAEKPQTLANAVLSFVFPLCLLAVGVAPEQWGCPVFAVVMVVAVAACIFAWKKRSKTRMSYRQDPRKEPKPDKKYYAGMAVLFAPALLMWAFDEKIWLGIAAAFIWGCAMFWALQSDALDLNKRASRNA